MESYTFMEFMHKYAPEELEDRRRRAMEVDWGDPLERMRNKDLIQYLPEGYLEVAKQFPRKNYPRIISKESADE